MYEKGQTRTDPKPLSHPLSPSFSPSHLTPLYHQWSNLVQPKKTPLSLKGGKNLGLDSAGENTGDGDGDGRSAYCSKELADWLKRKYDARVLRKKEKKTGSQNSRKEEIPNPERHREMRKY
ncbi:unnamed protein product [Rodentolepis nana]|uniref:Nuclear protein MDM1 n=1 Tax=Rodentolepis nana TaxID=102285 RepID=A0A0R3TXB8_RODNA|nr:unnamed protein product [Rodentolepis nana]